MLFTFVVECKRRIDVGFLIDVSSGVGRANVVYIRRFVTKLISRFTVHSRYTRIGVVIYSTRSRKLIGFSHGNKSGYVTKIINRVKYIGGRSYTGRALYYVKKYLFSGRPKCGVKRVLIVISSVSRDRITRPSKALTGIGVETFVIVTNVKAYRQLRIIATTRTHVIMTSYRSIIKVVLNRLAKRICKHPIGKSNSVYQLKVSFFCDNSKKCFLEIQ